MHTFADNTQLHQSSTPSDFDSLIADVEQCADYREIIDVEQCVDCREIIDVDQCVDCREIIDVDQCVDCREKDDW